MRSSYEILSATHFVVAQALAVDPINITGEVIIGQQPMGSQKEDVTLNMLNNPGGYIQSGILNFNLYVQGYEGEKPNLIRMKTIMDAAFPLFDDIVHNVQDITLHFTVDNDGGVKPDFDNKGRFYHNVRVNFVTL